MAKNQATAPMPTFAALDLYWPEDENKPYEPSPYCKRGEEALLVHRDLA